ncbi:MAG: GDSL-type esterase/lipase family protein [Porcipelethomonas sp.]
MKTVLAFGDSNTFGLNPEDHSRFDGDTRWTGLLNSRLNKFGFHVIEEGLCGRTTVFHDKKRHDRRGIDVLPLLLESHAPIEYVILMLGTNDCKTAFNATAKSIADGIKQLIAQIRMKSGAKILLISPIHLADGVGDEEYDIEFDENSVEVSKKLKEEFQKLAKAENCMFIAASDHAGPSEADREHLDEKGHKALADAIFNVLYNDFK